MMRFKTVQQPDGCWMIYDTQKREVCLGTRSGDRPEAERWTEVLNSAYAAFRDEVHSPLLPLPGERLVSRRKAMILAALREGETTAEEVCRFYSLSRDELGRILRVSRRPGAARNAGSAVSPAAFVRREPGRQHEAIANMMGQGP